MGHLANNHSVVCRLLQKPYRTSWFFPNKKTAAKRHLFWSGTRGGGGGWAVKGVQLIVSRGALRGVLNARNLPRLWGSIPGQHGGLDRQMGLRWTLWWGRLSAPPPSPPPPPGLQDQGGGITQLVAVRIMKTGVPGRWKIVAESTIFLYFFSSRRCFSTVLVELKEHFVRITQCCGFQNYARVFL